MYKRVLSLLFITIFIISIFSINVFASIEEETSSVSTESTNVTKKPTQAPTLPPFTAEYYGYSEYVKKLEKTYYKGNLGATYSKENTTFKLWSPAAKSVKVCIYKTGSDNEEFAEMISETTMNFSEVYGTWYLTLDGDYKNYYYTYKVDIEGSVNEIVDPYAKAAGVNGNRGMIVDLASTNPEDWDKDKFDRVDDPNQAIIWEVSVRDFSSSSSSGISPENRGKFLAFTESGTLVNSISGGLSTCVDYLKELGVNYVQINPFYDFASVDESKVTSDQYNWGYDPKNYNVPEGSYSSNPYDGNTRIIECKQMIQALHNAGIGVIMDVVYNHTFESEKSWFNLAVPNYYYRISENGTWSNGSGCGNDTASERIMFREYMKNSVMYWAEEYHIDGFRFDLMGLHDIDTMNYIRENLDTIDKNILMYGEAWSLDTITDSNIKLATQDNMYLLSDRIAAFNDTMRDSLKGSVFEKLDKGFIQEGNKRAGVKSGIEGMSVSDWAISSSQCVNYASCHDNLTLYDKLINSVKNNEEFTTRYEDLVSMNKLSAATILTSKGMSFMLAGEEMGRTKLGDSNSYMSDISINEIDWNNLNKYRELVEYYKGLISLRKVLALSNDNNKIEFLDNPGDNVIAFKISSETSSVLVVLNGSNSDKNVNFSEKGKFIQVTNELFSGLNSLGSIENSNTKAKSHSASIYLDENTFNSIGNFDEKHYLFVEFKDIENNSIFYQQIKEGLKGEEYTVSTPDDVLFNYDIITNSGNTNGKLDDYITNVTINCRPYKGSFGTVTFKYQDDNGNDLANSVILTNREGQQYFTPNIASINGYKLDIDNLPKNGAGKYNKSNIDVIYKYIPNDSVDENKQDDDNPYKSIANIIYMGSNGEILDTKSYMGVTGDIIDVEYLQFEGFQFVANSNQEAIFDLVEKNIVLSYQKDKPELPTLLFAIVGVLIIAVLSIIIYGIIKNKKNSKNSLFIDN